MRMIRALAAIAALLFLTGCDWLAPNSKMEQLGPGIVQGRIAYKPEEQKCGFVVGVPAKSTAGDIAFVGTAQSGKAAYEKCLTIRGGEQIRIVQVTKLIGKDKGKPTFYWVKDGQQFKFTNSDKSAKG